MEHIKTEHGNADKYDLVLNKFDGCDNKIYQRNELDNVKYSNGIFTYTKEGNDIILKKGEKRLGGGKYGEVFKLKSEEPDSSIPELAVKFFLRDTDPEIDFVEKKSGIFEKCNLIPSKILRDEKGSTVNVMFEVKGNLEDFKYLKYKKKQELAYKDFLKIAQIVLDMLICLKKDGLLYTDLKGKNILYSCHSDNNRENIKTIRIYMGDTGSIVKEKGNSNPINSFRPSWFKKYAQQNGRPRTSLTKNEQYIIFSFGKLLLDLFITDKKVPSIFRNDGDTVDGGTKIRETIDGLNGRFYDEQQNKNIKELIKILIRYDWFKLEDSIAEDDKTRTLIHIKDIINILVKGDHINLNDYLHEGTRVENKDPQKIRRASSPDMDQPTKTVPDLNLDLNFLKYFNTLTMEAPIDGFKKNTIKRIEEIYKDAIIDYNCFFNNNCSKGILEKYSIETIRGDDLVYDFLTNIKLKLNSGIIMLVSLYLVDSENELAQKIHGFLDKVIPTLGEEVIFNNVLEKMSEFSDEETKGKIQELKTDFTRTGTGGGGKRRVRSNKKRKGRQVNKTEKKNRRSIRKRNSHSRKKERTPRERLQRKKTPKKRR